MLLHPLIASGKLLLPLPPSQKSVNLMNDLFLQGMFLIPLFRDGLGYTDVKANTARQSLIIEENLQATICLPD